MLVFFLKSEVRELHLFSQVIIFAIKIAAHIHIDKLIISLYKCGQKYHKAVYVQTLSADLGHVAL
jgi:hypothetical protein